MNNEVNKKIYFFGILTTILVSASVATASLNLYLPSVILGLLAGASISVLFKIIEK